MTLSHLQHSQPCSHLLAPGPCVAGTSLTAPFGEAHSPPPVEAFRALQVQIQQPPPCRYFGTSLLFLPMVCHGVPVTSLLLGLQLGQLAEPPAAPSSPVLPSQCCQVVAVTSHPKAAVNSPELLLQREVTQRQSREPGPPCV